MKLKNKFYFTKDISKILFIEAFKEKWKIRKQFFKMLFPGMY
jgi:hypothetical protein